MLALLAACHPENKDVDYRQEMRDFVVGISQYARCQHPNFIVIPQNGIELVSSTDAYDGPLAYDYLNAIDGHGQEDLLYGINGDDVPTPGEDTEYLLYHLQRSQAVGNRVLVIDYCSSSDYVSTSYTVNNQYGFISFAANSRLLDRIPSTAVYSENTRDIHTLDEAQNFLYLINPERYSSKQAFIDDVCATNYDVLVMDLFFNGDDSFTSEEVAQLRRKQNGGSRLVIAYMSIGEAEDYRYYWQKSWNTKRPSWIAEENPDWAGNYKVRYWQSEWQRIIYGSSDSYLDRILAANFDGVYLDIIDAFGYFE